MSRIIRHAVTTFCAKNHEDVTKIVDRIYAQGGRVVAGLTLDTVLAHHEFATLCLISEREEEV